MKNFLIKPYTHFNIVFKVGAVAIIAAVALNRPVLWFNEARLCGQVNELDANEVGQMLNHCVQMKLFVFEVMKACETKGGGGRHLIEIIYSLLSDLCQSFFFFQCTVSSEFIIL